MILKQSNCTKQKLSFGCLGRRVVEANFNGGDISSDDGLMLLRQIVYMAIEKWTTVAIEKGALKT